MNKSQLEIYQEKQCELVKDFNGDIIAVKDGVCLGKFDTFVEALRSMKNKGYTEGDYMIIKCTPDNTEYTAFFANYISFTENCYA